MAESAWLYVRAVARHFWWLAASVVGASASLLNLVRDVRVPLWLTLAVAFAALTVAQFLAFHDLRRQQRATTQADARIHFKNRLLRQLSDARPALKADTLEEWARETHDFLRESVGEGEAQAFTHQSKSIILALRYLEGLRSRADSVSLLSTFDVGRWRVPP